MRFIYIVLLFLPVASLAQDTVQYDLGNAGGDFLSANTLASRTIGEVATETFISSTHTVSQGFHEENLLVDRINEIFLNDYSIKVYPNPTSDFLTIEAGVLNKEFRIIDIDGRIRLSGYVISELQQIDFTGLPAGTYFFQVEKHKTHKIIKP
jgi:hypothetical protein